jgi:hypothetical protein
MSEREFNDRILASGPVPIEMIRAELLDLPLTPETSATWKFAGDVPAPGDAAKQ